MWIIPFGEGKLFSDPFPTGVAGKERDAWTAESIFSQSRVGELGADFRVTSCCLSRTASSCRKSEGWNKKKKAHIYWWLISLINTLFSLFGREEEEYTLCNNAVSIACCWLSPAARTPTSEQSQPNATTFSYSWSREAASRALPRAESCMVPASTAGHLASVFFPIC